jgi:hypothetical protein
MSEKEKSVNVCAFFKLKSKRFQGENSRLIIDVNNNFVMHSNYLRIQNDEIVAGCVGSQLCLGLRSRIGNRVMTGERESVSYSIKSDS